MIHLLALVLSISPAFAQDSFDRYCGHLSSPAPAPMRPNVKIGNLAAVADAVNGTPKLMKESVARGLDYEEFKAEMAAKKIGINDQFHQAGYEQIARARCETTEGSTGNMSVQAHSSPTAEQLGRRVDDSGIGVGGPNTGEPGATGSETER